MTYTWGKYNQGWNGGLLVQCYRVFFLYLCDERHISGSHLFPPFVWIFSTSHSHLLWLFVYLCKVRSLWMLHVQRSPLSTIWLPLFEDTNANTHVYVWLLFFELEDSNANACVYLRLFSTVLFEVGNTHAQTNVLIWKFLALPVYQLYSSFFIFCRNRNAFYI